MAYDIAEIIKGICVNYTPLSPLCIADLLGHASLSVYDKNTILVKEGQFDDRSFFIVKGAARAYYLKDGKDITDWFAFEQDFICSLDCFFNATLSSHYIELLEPSILLEIPKVSVDQLSDTYRDFDRLGKAVITKTMLQLQRRIVSIQFETAAQRYDSLLKVYPHVTQRVALTYIASYLGITLETLSRIRSSKKRI